MISARHRRRPEYNFRMSGLYPIHLDVRGRRCLVVGGGAVALRKVRGLLAAQSCIRLVAPEVLREADDLPGLQIFRERYRREHLEGCRLAIAATNDPAVNASVADDAKAAGILCCVTDDPEAGDFQVPAVVRRGPLTIAVGTGGASPALAARVRRVLESAVGPEYSLLAEELEALRTRVRAAVSNPVRRRELLQLLASESAVERLSSEGPEAFRKWADAQIG